MEFGKEAEKQERFYRAAMESAGVRERRFYRPAMGSEKAVKFVPGLPNWETGSSGPNSRLSRRCDLFTLRQQYLVNTMYKRKKDRMLPVKTSESTGEKPGGTQDWKRRILEKMPLVEDPSNWQPQYRFRDHILPKRSGIQRGTRLTPERIGLLKMGEEIGPDEKEMLLEILYTREAALTFEWSEIGRVREEVTPPVKIRTVPHEPWTARGFPVPKPLQPVANEMFRERIKVEVLEDCNGPYRNFFFLVSKGNGKYRLINAAVFLNKVSIKDANLPPSTDEFSEDFSGMAIASVIDLFSGYDQVPLDPVSRDLTAFQTQIGLLRMTTLPQGWTNSVPEFVRIVKKILADEIPNDCDVYVDDVPVKGPRTKYDNREVLPGIRQYVYEHLRSLDRSLFSLEVAGVTIAPLKSQFCVPAIKVVGYVCDFDGRHPEKAKVIKILDWPPCANAHEARSFIGVVVYYRVWIEGFAIIASPIYSLLRKNEEFCWGWEQQAAMDKLKVAVTSAPALTSIEYPVSLPNGTVKEVGAIIVTSDASYHGWGGSLNQQVLGTNKRKPARFESGIWTKAESNYDAGKLECRAVLKVLKKFRSYLYGVRFVLEVDAATLVAQLNRPATDLPGSVVVRWIAWIRLFDFDVKHVPGTKNTVADGLSRRPATEEDVKEAENDNTDEFLDAQFSSMFRVSLITASLGERSEEFETNPVEVGEENEDDGHVLETPDEEWSEESQKIARWLVTLRRPAGMNRREYHAFKRKATEFIVQDKALYRRARRNQPVRRVVDDPRKRERILRSLHDEFGHRGREGTYQRISKRYWWSGLWSDVGAWVKHCDACQRASNQRWQEELNPTPPEQTFKKWHLDIVVLSHRETHPNCLIVARESSSGWVEARALSSAAASPVARFIYEDIFCRWGCMEVVVSDSGPETKDVTMYLWKKYRVKHVRISAYNSKANGFIEVGHKPIVQALRKLTFGLGRGWRLHLHSVLWADRNTVRSSTGMTPFRFVMGVEAVLPIELEVPTWQTLPWERVQSTADLLALRARQIERRDRDTEEALLRVQRHREDNRDRFNSREQLRETPIEKHSLVLLHDTKRETSYSDKLGFRWLGPYRVRTVYDNGAYLLEELDGTVFGASVHGNRLKPFFSLLDPESPDAEFLEGPVDDSMEPPEHADENQQNVDEHSDEEVLGDELPEDKGQDHEDETGPDNSSEEDQRFIPEGRDLAVVVPGVRQGGL